MSPVDAFLILRLSRSVHLNHKQFSGEIKSDILTLLTLPSAFVKSAVSEGSVINQSSSAQFLVPTFSDGSVWSVGNLTYICDMWKGR